ncbi:hypothetical protein GOODEAATRI_021204 [Goodea atripinnis]|uniref:Uncharacterized protein n=1 Tax=Goodea atripinnis TaxID=208336 RepID=A0ABV0N4L7_9TELE
MEPSIVRVLAALTENLTRVFDVKIATVLEAINKQTAQMIAVDARVEEAEQRIADVETVATDSETNIADMEKQIKRMLECIDELDNRGRRRSVRVIGVPEGWNVNSLPYGGLFIPRGRLRYVLVVCMLDRWKEVNCSPIDIFIYGYTYFSGTWAVVGEVSGQVVSMERV